jgi:hypothetical protein
LLKAKSHKGFTLFSVCQFLSLFPDDLSSIGECKGRRLFAAEQVRKKRFFYFISPPSPLLPVAASGQLVISEKSYSKVPDGLKYF